MQQNDLEEKSYTVPIVFFHISFVLKFFDWNKTCNVVKRENYTHHKLSQMPLQIVVWSQRVSTVNSLHQGVSHPHIWSQSTCNRNSLFLCCLRSLPRCPQNVTHTHPPCIAESPLVVGRLQVNNWQLRCMNKTGCRISECSCYDMIITQGTLKNVRADYALFYLQMWNCRQNVLSQGYKQRGTNNNKNTKMNLNNRLRQGKDIWGQQHRTKNK